jgi:DnaJ-class molecular chaperone
MVKDTEYYDILEIKTDASPDEIQNNYKRIARKIHPDKNKNDPLASEKFQKLNEANEVLSDPNKRKLYDQFGKDFDKVQQGPDPSDIFGMFRGQQMKQEKENINVHTKVNLEQIYREENITVTYRQKISCNHCNGEGTNDGKSNNCETCNGLGSIIQVIRMGPMIQQIQTPCNTCRGTGKRVINVNKCNYCSGSGYKERDVKVKVPLKQGLDNNQQIQLQQQGHHLNDGKTDLMIILQIEEHEKFKRDGNNLIINIELKLYQALFGFDKIIEHMDGRKLYISHTGKTENGTKKRLSGEGLRDLRTNVNGDLIINFTYKLPDINNIEYINNLQVILKNIDDEEAKQELDIRVSKSQYIKSLLLDVNEEEKKSQPKFEGQRVHIDGPPECVHQ